MSETVPPAYYAEAFNCPYCRAYAHQLWSAVVASQLGYQVQPLMVSKCHRCNEYAYWLDTKLIWPRSSPAPPANPDLPQDIMSDYVEAATVLQDSPRASAALLRLAIQKLCGELVDGEKDLNAAIGALVKRGLSVHVQQALDIVRVIGNNAVHPGELDLRDDVETATALFRLVNRIAESMISEPKRVQEMFEKLPEGPKAAIAQRDAPKVEPSA